MSYLNITDQDFEAEVLKSEQPVLVDFWASWCGPCQMLAPIIEEIAEEFQGKIKVVKIDVDANPQSAQKYNILSIPTVIFFKNGQALTQLIGVQPKERFEEEIKKIIQP